MKYRELLRKINRTYINRGAGRITETDLKTVLQKAQNILDKAAKNETLRKVFADISALIELVRDYVRGNYREIPWYSLSAVAFTLLYIFNPLDLIPDFIPGLGLVDDAAVIALCLKMVNKDLDTYRHWRERLISSTN